MKKIISIEGMMCEKCCKRVKKALEAVEGVTSAETDLANKSASAEISGDVSDEVLTKAVTDAGYTVLSIS